MQTENFGEHFMLDGYGGDMALLDSKELVLGALNDLPEQLGMNKLAEPVVYFAADLSQKDPGGWSGFVVIAESHISIHTFAARGFVSIDAYTCKNGMDCAFIEQYFMDLFKLQNTETNFVKRGTRYPSFNLK